MVPQTTVPSNWWADRTSTVSVGFIECSTASTFAMGIPLPKKEFTKGEVKRAELKEVRSKVLGPRKARWS